MRRFERRHSASLKGTVVLCLLFLAFLDHVSAQTVQSTASASSTGSTSASSQLQAFQAEQHALAGEMRNLIAQGATPDQIMAWRQQNQARITAQHKLAQAISASQPARPIAYITDVNIPAGASQTKEDFLTARATLFNSARDLNGPLASRCCRPFSARATLFNSWAQLHNQQLQSSGTVNDSQVAVAFQQQDAAALQTQAQRAQVVAAESDQQVQAVPPPVVMPKGATAQMQSFFTLRDKLRRDLIQLHNQNTSSTPAVRQAALQQWLRQNAGRVQQLRQQARKLSATSSTSAN